MFSITICFKWSIISSIEGTSSFICGLFTPLRKLLGGCCYLKPVAPGVVNDGVLIKASDDFSEEW